MEISKETTSSIPSEKNITLIAEVKKFPSLYDNSDPNYYVLAERNKAWLQVAGSCGEPADLCHLRWKALRKRFAKEKRRFPEILQGRRRPWALFPKMSFLSSSRIAPRSKKKPKSAPKTEQPSENFKQHFSDDDMLIVDDNNEVVHTYKSGDVSEDEYIYETLDDPDSALEIMRSIPTPKVKPTAIRSKGAIQSSVAAPSRVGGSGRIRKLTPKMQNSMIAKKLKQAQQILQQPNTSNQKKLSLQQSVSNNSKNCIVNSSKKDRNILIEDKPTRHIATVNPNFVRKGNESTNKSASKNTNESTFNDKQCGTSSAEGNVPFKVIKLKGKNPLIFSPDQYPQIQSFLKSESSANQEIHKSPAIKVKSVDNLNNTNDSSKSQNCSENSSNLDIIHSVGLMRKNPEDKHARVEKINHHSYSRSYSWNRPEAKSAKQSSSERTQSDTNSQNNDYEIEETWNDIKEEVIDDEYWTQPHDNGYLPLEPMVMMHTPDEPFNSASSNSVMQAKLDLVTYKKALLTEQHQKTLEYMKREHDLKMTLLKAEIDLKRKQLNIML